MNIFELNVRNCQEKDLLFVESLLKRNMEEAMFKHWGEKWNSALFWEKTNPASITLIEYKGEPIAFFDAFEEKGFLHLLNMNVVEEFQRQGIGGYMLSLLEKKAQKMRLEKIFLEVFLDNNARLLYEKNGYKYVGKKNHCWIMEKMISIKNTNHKE